MANPQERESIRLYFKQPVTIMPAEPGGKIVAYQAGDWYDNVPEAHADQAGAAAVELELCRCGALVTDDGNEVRAGEEAVEKHDAEGKAYMDFRTRTTVEVHACPRASRRKKQKRS